MENTVQKLYFFRNLIWLGIWNLVANLILIPTARLTHNLYNDAVRKWRQTEIKLHFAEWRLLSLFYPFSNQFQWQVCTLYVLCNSTTEKNKIKCSDDTTLNYTLDYRFSKQYLFGDSPCSLLMTCKRTYVEKANMTLQNLSPPGDWKIDGTIFGRLESGSSWITISNKIW